jgi:schlafen family protein
LAKQNADLGEFLAEPREALDVEFKTWLDLTNNDHRALVAKEIIALANHGGGYLVIGFEELTDGSFRPASPRPSNLDAWSQDAIQSIVAKYIDPNVQCMVAHQTAPSNDRHPIIVVPGDHRIPIRAKSGSPDGKLVPHRAYIRRPGPTSEEPRTAEEWDRLLERCLQNRKSELLEAMRSIMAGVIPSTSQDVTPALPQLLQFEKAAIGRWEARVAGLPAGVPARFPHGYHDVAIAIDGIFKTQSLRELRHTIETAVRNHSGWPPFLTVNRAPFETKPIDGAVEFWRGPDKDGSYNAPNHSDFWRISPEGRFFTRSGYREDSGFQGLESGKFFDITASTWRLGEAILEAAHIATALDAVDANLICHCRWHGLSGRHLVSRGDPDRRHQAEQDGYEATQTVSLEAVPHALPELVFAILAPLYELFGFFQLPKRLVEQELASLQKNRF